MHDCFTIELTGECLKCLFRLTGGVPAVVVQSDMGRNAMTRTQMPFDNVFLSSPASLCTSKTVFLL